MTTPFIPVPWWNTTTPISPTWKLSLCQEVAELASNPIFMAQDVYPSSSIWPFVVMWITQRVLVSRWHQHVNLNHVNEKQKGGNSSKESTCQCRRHGFDPWVWKISWSRKWQPTPVFLPGKFNGQRSLVGYNPWGDRVRHNLAQFLIVTPRTPASPHCWRNKFLVSLLFNVVKIFDSL